MNLEQFKNQDKRQMGAIKRKLGIKPGEDVKTGTLLEKMNAEKFKNLSIKGLI
jgi:hypothetical protein